MTLQIEIDPDWKVGDIIKVQGKNHKITKKTTTAVAVRAVLLLRPVDG